MNPSAPSRRRRITAGAITLLVLLAACADRSTPRADRDALAAAEAIDARTGTTFPDYYEDVVRLAQRYSAHPDSFRAALDSLPGSHLSDEEWEAWVAPHVQDPYGLAYRLEEVITTLAAPQR